MVANSVQKAWVGWLLYDKIGKKFLGSYIGAERNFDRLKTIWSGAPYTDETKHMLNFVLEIFNRDKGLKGEYRRWFVTQLF